MALNRPKRGRGYGFFGGPSSEELSGGAAGAAKAPVVQAQADVPVRRPHVLAQHMSKLYASGTVSDCQLVSRDGKTFAAHRAILAAWSPVFSAMFSADMAEKASGVCRMENFDGSRFLYTAALSGVGECHCVEEMLELAAQYDMPDLAAACEDYMVDNVRVATAGAYLHLAQRRGLRAATPKLAHFICQNWVDFH